MNCVKDKLYLLWVVTLIVNDRKMVCMSRNALVIGATGLLGYGITGKLHKEGWKVRAIGKENVINSKIFIDGIEYICGDFYNESFLEYVLKDIDKVFFFLSSTFPSTRLDSLEIEISRTLKGLDYLLRKMRDMEVLEIVFPSSGGTVYGNIESGIAHETDILSPTTPYGMGKKMCEDILLFYSQFGISSTILRVGNVYGTPLVRKKTQGVIDIFIQKAINGEIATVWGDAFDNTRDYIFSDDFSEAVAMISKYKAEGVEIYNLSSGVGTTLKEIIKIINKYSLKPLEINHIRNDVTSSIKRIVLDMQKFKNKTGWEPKYDIEQGIAMTMEKKMKMEKLI